MAHFCKFSAQGNYWDLAETKEGFYKSGDWAQRKPS
jgi:hypothetical protein